MRRIPKLCREIRTGAPVARIQVTGGRATGVVLENGDEIGARGVVSGADPHRTFLGPRSPGTAYVLLHHYMGEIDGAFRAWGFPKNGTGGVSEAIASSARALGVEIRTGAGVQKVVVRGGRASGVALENGDELRAKVVLSAVDPKRSFLQLVDPEHFPGECVQAIRDFRVRGSSGKVNIALSELRIVF